MACDVNHDASPSIQFNTTPGQTLAHRHGLDLFASKILSLLKDNKKAPAFSYISQQSDHGRRIAKIGKESVGRMLPQLADSVLT